MDREEGTSTERSPASSRLPASGPTGQLAAHAAVALVREELAHALSSPVSFLRMIVTELEEGKVPGAGQLEVAREEVDRLHRLVASLRALPGIRVVPAPQRLAVAVVAAVRDLS